MKKIRIGNDIPIKWTINRDGQPEDFSGKTIKLLMRSMSEEVEITDYQIDGNVISWTFFGKDQTKSTAYTFTLIENEGQEGMFTIDACRVLQLVECSDQADDDDSDMNVEESTDGTTGYVTADSEIQIPADGSQNMETESDTVVIEGEHLLKKDIEYDEYSISWEGAQKLFAAAEANKRIVLRDEGLSADIIGYEKQENDYWLFAYFAWNKFFYMNIITNEEEQSVSVTPRIYEIPLQ